MPNKYKYIFAVVGFAIVLIVIVYVVYERRIDAMEHRIRQELP